MTELTRDEAAAALAGTRPTWAGWRVVAVFVGLYGTVQAVVRLVAGASVGDVVGVVLGSATAGVLIVAAGLLWQRRALRRLGPASLVQAHVDSASHASTRSEALLVTDDGVRARVLLGDAAEALEPGATIWCVGLEPQGATRIVVRGATGDPAVLDVVGPTNLEWDPSWRSRL